MKIDKKPLSIFLLLLSVFFICSIIFHVFSWKGTESIFLILCTSCSLVLTLALVFTKKCRLHNPLIYILLTVFIGVTLRGYYMVYASSNYFVRNNLLGAHDIDYFIIPTFVILYSLIVFIIGYKYVKKPYSFKKLKLFSFDHVWDQRRILFLVLVFSVISILGFLLFVRTLGIFSILADISAKRYLKVSGSDHESSLGYYRLMVSFIVPAFYIYLLNFIVQNKKILSFQGLVLVVLGLANLFFPFFMSSRSPMVYFVLNIIIILSITEKLTFRSLVIGVLSVSFLFSVATTLRSSDSNEVDVKEISLIDPIVLNRNLLDVSVTSNIVNQVPEKMSYQYGKSFLTLFVAPIPRRLWPGKPSVMLGKTISHEIYDYSDKVNIGIPPGVIGELYLNFSLIGILMGLFMIGVFIKKVYLYFNFEHAFNKNKTILYIAVVMNITVLLFGGSINQAILGFVQSFITVYIGLKFISK